MKRFYHLQPLLAGILFGLLSQPAYSQTLAFSDNAWRLKPATVSFTAQTPDAAYMKTIDLPVENIRGNELEISVSLKASSVSSKPQPWNGIKVMLKIETEGETAWPQLDVPVGSFGWKVFSGKFSIPKTARKASLLIGLENVSGKVDMRDLSLKLRLAGFMDVAGRSIFTGHDPRGLRGAMVNTRDIGPADFETLVKDWGANVIRWQLIRREDDGQDDGFYDAWLESSLDKLDEFLVQAESLGCRVVVDLHSPPGGGMNPGLYVDAGTVFFNSAESQKRFIKAWKQIALRYKGRQSIWGFDLLNEPYDKEKGADCLKWDQLAAEAGRAIRDIDPDRTLIVECAGWASPYAFAFFTPLPLERVVYSFHMYIPFEYTHQGLYGMNTPYAYPGKIAGKTWNRAALVDFLYSAIEFSKKNGVQMYVGEFGAVRWSKGADQYFSDLISIFEEYHWDWCYQAFREWEGWSAEHDDNRTNTAPAAQETARLKALKQGFALNAAMK